MCVVDYPMPRNSYRISGTRHYVAYRSRGCVNIEYVLNSQTRKFSDDVSIGSRFRVALGCKCYRWQDGGGLWYYFVDFFGINAIDRVRLYRFSTALNSTKCYPVNLHSFTGFVFCAYNSTICIKLRCKCCRLYCGWLL